MIHRAVSSQSRDCKEDSCSIKARIHVYVETLRGFCLWEDERWIGIKITRWQCSFLIKPWYFRSNWSRVYLIRKIAGSLNNLQYKACTKERVGRLSRMCRYLAGGYDAWKKRWHMETAYNGTGWIEARDRNSIKKKNIITSNSSRPAGQKGKGEQEALQ